jgi:ribonuclease Z
VTFSLTILGSSSAVPTSNRFPAAHVINLHERCFLIDCGEGTQIQLRRNNIGLGKIDHIFITHIHGDHTFGLFGLISTLNLLGRKNDLHLYASPLLELILNDHFKYFYDRPLAFRIIFHPLGSKKKQLIYEDSKALVFSFPLKHRIPACGFLFQEKPPLLNLKKDMIRLHQVPVNEMQNIKSGKDFCNDKGEVIPNELLTMPPLKARSLAYCTDTRYTESILPVINNADVLYHEATYLHELKERARETGHSTAREAGIIARKANVGKLVIGHFSARYKTTEQLVNEARSEFSESYAANEGDVYHIEQIRMESSQ